MAIWWERHGSQYVGSDRRDLFQHNLPTMLSAGFAEGVEKVLQAQPNAPDARALRAWLYLLQANRESCAGTVINIDAAREDLPRELQQAPRLPDPPWDRRVTEIAERLKAAAAGAERAEGIEGSYLRRWVWFKVPHLWLMARWVHYIGGGEGYEFAYKAKGDRKGHSKLANEGELLSMIARELSEADAECLLGFGPITRRSK